MKRQDDQPSGQWDRGWDVHKKRQLQRAARLSLAEKFKWLEEAQELTEFLVSQARRQTKRDIKR